MTLRVPAWPSGAGDWSTESYLGAIGRDVSPAAEAWARGLCEFKDPRGERDRAIRAAASPALSLVLGSRRPTASRSDGGQASSIWSRRNDKRCEPKFKSGRAP